MYKIIHKKDDSCILVILKDNTCMLVIHKRSYTRNAFKQHHIKINARSNKRKSIYSCVQDIQQFTMYNARQKNSTIMVIGYTT